MKHLLTRSEMTEFLMQRSAERLHIPRDCYPTPPYLPSDIVDYYLQNGESEPPEDGLEITRFDFPSKDESLLGISAIRCYSRPILDEDGDVADWEDVGYSIVAD